LHRRVDDVLVTVQSRHLFVQVLSNIGYVGSFSSGLTVGFDGWDWMMMFLRRGREGCLYRLLRCYRRVHGGLLVNMRVRRVDGHYVVGRGSEDGGLWQRAVWIRGYLVMDVDVEDELAEMYTAISDGRVYISWTCVRYS
jgi:hypothetical protein